MVSGAPQGATLGPKRSPPQGTTGSAESCHGWTQVGRCRVVPRADGTTAPGRGSVARCLALARRTARACVCAVLLCPARSLYRGVCGQDGCKIGDDGMRAIAKNCKELKTVSVVGCRATELSLGLLAPTCSTTGGSAACDVSLAAPSVTAARLCLAPLAGPTPNGAGSQRLNHRLRCAPTNLPSALAPFTRQV